MLYLQGMLAFDPNYVPEKNYFLVGLKSVVINPQNEILVLTRSHRISRPGGLDFCGGALELNETPIAGIEREIVEECGLQPHNTRLVSSSIHFGEGNDRILLLGFVAYVDSSDVAINWENSHYEWVPLEKAASLPLPKPLLDILKFV